MASVTSSLIVSLIDRVTAPAKAVASSVKGIGRAVASANTGGLERAIAANSASMSALHGRMLGATAAAYGLYKGLSLPIKAAADFETSMANIKKVVDFDSPKAFKEMGEDIRKLSLRLPMTADQIASIVAAGGQSGVANEDLLAFAEIATKVGVAWDMSADKTGEALAKLKTSLGYTIPQTELLADAINYLSNKTAASAPDILEMTRRVAPLAKLFGLTAEQASAFGAAMVGSGFEPEVAATSFRNMGKALTVGSSATKAQQKAFARIGTSSTQVAKLMQKNAVGTIGAIFKRINQIPVEQRASLMSDLFGDEARALAPLITNGELLAETLALINDKTKYAGSSSKEYAEQADTTNNKMVLFSNHISEVSKALGEGLTPGLNEATEALKPYLLSVADWAKKNPGLVAGLAKTAIAAVGLSGALLAGGYVMLGLKGIVLSLAKPILAATVAMAGLTRSMLIAPIVAGVSGAFRLLTAAVVGTVASFRTMSGLFMLMSGGALMGSLRAGIVGIGAALTGLLSPMALVAGAMKLLKLAVISTGVGAILVAIAMAGLFIYENWAGLGEFFTSFGQAFTAALGPLAPAVQPLIDGIRSLWNTVSGFFGEISPATWAQWGASAGAGVGAAVVAILELPGRISGLAGQLYNVGIAAMESLWSGLKAKVAEIKAWVGGMIGDVVNMIPEPIRVFMEAPPKTGPAPTKPKRAEPRQANNPEERPPITIIGRSEAPVAASDAGVKTPVDLSHIEAMSIAAAQAGSGLQELNGTVTPKVDLTPLQRLIDLSRQAKSELREVGAMSTAAGGALSGQGSRLRLALDSEFSDAGM